MSERRKTSRGQPQTGWIVAIVAGFLVCACVALLALVARPILDLLSPAETATTPRNNTHAGLTIAVSPGMAATFIRLVEQFNAQSLKTPDGQGMQIATVTLAPEDMVAQSLSAPTFQAIAPDSSLWLSRLDREWAALQGENGGDEMLIPIGNRRFGEPVRYATSPVIIAAWESVARELGWPERAVGWATIQQRATSDPTFKWNHPSTGHASGLLATLAEFYAGAGLTRGLTAEAATAASTIEYVRAVEATVRFYGEGEDVIVARLAEKKREFLDAFVTQEQVVIAWNQAHPTEPLAAIYPAEGTLWADHPLALLELTGPGETPVSDNQRRTYQAFVAFITSVPAQQLLLQAGYRPADMTIRLDQAPSPFAGSAAVDWRQPQTTLQIPAADVVEVVRNVWWYTKRPTNVYLVVDTSGSMEENNKLELTKQALKSFIEQIRGDRDQVGLITFSSDVRVDRALQPLDDAGRADLLRAADAIESAGQTALIDGVARAFAELEMQNDPDAINAIVVMTDGIENASGAGLNELRTQVQNSDTRTVIFTIAFGADADADLLTRIAEIGGGQFRRATETDIEELYKIISTYF